MDPMPKQILVTGGTGLVGSFLVPRLLRAFPDSRIVLLVRASSATALEERMRRLLTFCSSEARDTHAPERIVGLRGDVTLPDLGVGPDALEGLLARTTHIVHGAATIRFDRSLQEARATNVVGTERMLALAERMTAAGVLKRFLYVGTSSVSGRRGGMIYERELEKGQRFFNTYEESKYESERLVRNTMDRVPVTVVRPSIVVGDSRTGRTTTFNVIYLPLRLFHRGLLNILPGSPDTVLDLVPVDWVDDVITRLLDDERAAGAVCHLTAGPARAVPLGALIDTAASYFDHVAPLREPRRVTYVTMEKFRTEFTGRGAGPMALLAQLDSLLPYITVNRLFDTTTTETLLEGSGLVFPRFEEYADRILEYCVKTGWGKRQGPGEP